jgi:Tfp pilus assembly protein PilF
LVAHPCRGFQPPRRILGVIDAPPFPLGSPSLSLAPALRPLGANAPMPRIASLSLLLLAAACSSTPSDEERQLASYQQNAGLYFEGGKFDQSLHLIDKGLEIEPDDYKLLSLRACIHLRQSGPASGSDHKLLDQAINEFEEVFDQRDVEVHDRFLLFWHSLALQKQGNRLMTEAARIDKHAEDADRRAQEMNQDADECLSRSRQLLLALLARGEIPRLSNFHLFQIALLTRNDEQLLEHGEKFLEASANDMQKTQAEIDRTTVYGYEQEKKEWQKQLRGDEIGVRIQLGERHFARGDYEAALRHVDAILAIDPVRSDLRYNRGQILRKLGRNDEAKDDLRTFLATTSLPPDSAKVREAVEALRQ